MTDHYDELDRLIDLAADDIRSQRLDDLSERQAVDRVWNSITDGQNKHRPLAGCEDIQAEIPAFVEGTLGEARAMLIGDHTRECVACRRVLMEARGGGVVAGTPSRVRGRSNVTRLVLRVAAAVVLLAGGYGVYLAMGNTIANRSLTASIESVDGSLQRVDTATSALQVGDTIGARHVLRTTKDSSAMIRLADGSLIEVDQRSEFSLHAGRRGTTIDLARGNIIVHAAKQQGGRLFVDTSDCEVMVKGTIFAVDRGLKGSRVSVIEGEVEVREGASNARLQPGDQITTGSRLRPVPVEEQVSWSRDAAKHKALVRELSHLRRVVAEVVDNAPPRTSTFLLDLAPPDTLVYAAMPNITEDLDEARAALAERLSSSEVLAQWWEEQVVSTGLEVRIDELLDRLEPIGDALGAETVIAVPATVLDGSGLPILMAELDDPEAFREILIAAIDEANAETGGDAGVVLVDDPITAEPIDAEVVVWIADTLFAAAHDLDSLRSLAVRLDDPAARSFVGTTLHTRLAETYATGVSWIGAVDLATAIAEATSKIPADQAEALAEFGLTNAETLVVERHRDGDWYATNGEVQFAGPRTGMMAWLAEPAAMGSLDFVSPQATLVASAVTRDAAEMFDDLLAYAIAQDERVFEGLALFEERFGIDLRNDLAATFGGEGTIAVDGPVLPIPSWKLIVEIYDMGTFVHTIETAVPQINAQLEAEGREERIELTSVEANGRTYYTLGRTGSFQALTFAAVDGYLIMAPMRAVIDQAISNRDAGVTLPASEAFQSLLPDNGYTDCSALVYRDLGGLINAIPPEVFGDFGLTGELGDDFGHGLVCVFGEPDRVTAASTGGSLLGLTSFLGLQGALHGHDAVEELEKRDALSSQG